MNTYRASFESEGKTVSYRVKKRKAGSCGIVIAGNDVTVMVPEIMTSAAVEKYVADNAALIMEKLMRSEADALPGGEALATSGALSGGNAISTSAVRSREDFEMIIRTLFQRRFLELPKTTSPVCGSDAPPTVTFRQMATMIASFYPEKNMMCFSRALTGSKKETIDLAVSYAIALLFGNIKTAAFAEKFNELCPEWRESCRFLPEKLGESLREALRVR